MKLTCMLLLTGSLLVGRIDGKPSGAESRTPSNYRRFFEMLGLRGEKERQLHFVPQPNFVNPGGEGGYYQPCARLPILTTSTTPVPLVGPMCPIYPQPNVIRQPNPGFSGNVIPSPPLEPVRPISANNIGNLYPPHPPQRPGAGGDVLIGGNANALGGNIYPPPEPFRPIGGQNLLPPEPPRPPNSGNILVGGPASATGGNVYPQPQQPAIPRPGGTIVVGLGNFQPVIPERPNNNNILIGGSGNAIGGDVLYPDSRPPPAGDVLIGGNANAQGGNVYPSPGERPHGGILVGGPPVIGNLYPPRPPQRPEGDLLIGGNGNGHGGDVSNPDRPLLPSSSEHRPVPVPFPYGPQPSSAQYPVGGGGRGLFPFLPQGFIFPTPHLIPYQQECPLSPRPDIPLCSTMEILDKFQLRIMYQYIVKAGLEQLFEMTYNYTLFVPADPAFASLPEWFLDSLDNDVKLLRAFVLNHYIKVDAPLYTLGNEFLIMNGRPGGNRLRSNVYFPDLPYRIHTLDGSKVLLGDIMTRTGRLNIVNRVIVPNPPRNAAQYIQEVPEFSNFLSAVVTANMLDFLQGPDPFTIFIPFNDAFNSFDFKALLGNSTALRNFVNHHIVRGSYYSNGLVNDQYLTTLFDKEIRLSVSSDGFSKSITVVNNVNRVLKSDISLLNGVAHILNGALSNIHEFYLYPHMNEFHTLNFGNLKRNMVMTESQLNEEHSSL